MRISRERLGFLIGVVAIVIFGGSLPSTRLSVAELDPWFVTALRTTIAGVVAVALLAGGRVAFPRRDLAMILAIAACTIIGFPAGLSLASVSVPAAHGGVVLGLLPLTTTVGAVLFAGERPSVFFWILSLTGGALVIAFAAREGAAIVAGDTLLVGVIVLGGFGYAMAGQLSRTVPGWQVIAWTVIVSLPIALPLTILWWPADAATVSPWAWGGVAFSGIVILFVGYALWNIALAWGGVARIGQIQLIQPFVTFAIAAALLGERVDLPMILFAIAVGIVVAMSQRARVAGVAKSE